MGKPINTRTLSEFLRRESELPFEWGQSDCSLLLANWFSHIHGVDPAAHLRGTYSSPDGKDAVLVAHGGLLRLVGTLARSAGAPRTSSPNTGDFGLIAVGDHPYGAICTGRVAGKACWVVRSETGLTFLTNPRILRAWSIHVQPEVATAAVGGAD